MKWSEQQEAIFQHVESDRGSLIIKARAGVGKSTVLVECANRAKGRILLSAFNKSIADELGSRITGNPYATAATLHSVGFSQWRKIRSHNEVDGRKVRAIAKTYSQWDKAHTDVLVDAVEYAKHIGFGVPGLPAIDSDTAWTELFDHYDLWDEVPSGISPDRIIGECVKTYKESVRMACDEGRIDFSDMLLLPLMFANGKPELYDTVMIDECQDTSATRRLMALHVLKTGGRVIAVGDDFQCIFHFAGATANAMDLIKEAVGAEELPLNITYRCPKSVVKLAQSWCPDYTAHEANPEGIVRTISHLKFWGEQLVPSKDAILCRNTRPLVGVARRLRNNGIPCVVEGQSGKAIIALALKWGGDITVDQLDSLLSEYLEKELEKWRGKGREDKTEWVGEKVGILRDLMEDVEGDQPVRKLVQRLEMTFGEGQYQGQELVRLCTIHRCVHPNTLVETTSGLVRMRDIGDSGCIQTPSGLQHYTGKFTRQNGPTLKIKTKRGFELEVTPDHGMMVWGKSEHVHKRADELAVGDWLRVYTGAPVDNQWVPSVPPAPPNINSHEYIYPVPDRMTEELAEFLGLMVADGTVYKGGFRVVKRHTSVTERFKTLVRFLFHDPGLCTEETNYEGTPAASFNSTYISKWLLSIGGLAPKDKYVPNIILQSPLKYQAAFLRGLFEDGTVNRKGEYVDHLHWENRSYEVAGVVQTLLLRFGIVATRRHHRTSNKDHEICTLYIYSQHAKKFAEQIGFVASEKNMLLNAKYGEDTHLLVPMSRVEVEKCKPFFASVMDKQNAYFRGYVSRNVAEKILKKARLGAAYSMEVPDLSFLVERMRWAYQPIKSITVHESETMCVEVPEGGRFLQNGFDGFNSKGREWDRVFILGRNRYQPSKWAKTEADCQGERNLAYVAVTRAKRELVEVTVPIPDPKRGGGMSSEWWEE